MKSSPAVLDLAKADSKGLISGVVPSAAGYPSQFLALLRVMYVPFSSDACHTVESFPPDVVLWKKKTKLSLKFFTNLMTHDPQTYLNLFSFSRWIR